MKDKLGKFVLIVTTLASLGLITFSLWQWSISTDHGERFDWMLMAGVGAFVTFFLVITLRRAWPKAMA